MGTWNKAVITKKGNDLQAKLINQDTLLITKAFAGAGKVPIENLSEQTAVTDIKQELTLQEKSFENGVAQVPVLLLNDTLQTGYTLYQIGLYAEDPDEGEILYCILQDEDGDIIPSESESPGLSIEWTIAIGYGSAGKVEVTINKSGLVTYGGGYNAFASKALEEVVSTGLQQLHKDIALLEDRKADLVDDVVPENQLPDSAKLSLGETANTAYRGDRGKLAYDHMSVTNNPHNTTAVQVGADPAGSASTVQTNLTAHINNKTNPHGVTAAQVGADSIGSASAVQNNLNNHVSDSDIHLTSEYREKIFTLESDVQNKINSSEKGIANGVAPLDKLGQVPVTSLNYAFLKDNYTTNNNTANRNWFFQRLAGNVSETNPSRREVTYYESVFVTIWNGNRSAYLYISCDGVRWIPVTVSASGNPNAWSTDNHIETGNGLFFVANSRGGFTFTPYDAKTLWNRVILEGGDKGELPYNEYIYSYSDDTQKLFFYKDRFYILRKDGRLSYTTDGATLTHIVNSADTSGGIWVDFACNDSYFVIMREDGIVATCPSTGSSTWTLKAKFSNISTTGTTNAYGVKFVNNTFVLFYYQNASRYMASYYATNPTGSWTYKMLTYQNWPTIKVIKEVLYFISSSGSLYESYDLGVTTNYLGSPNTLSSTVTAPLIDIAISDAGTMVVSAQDDYVSVSNQGIPVNYQERQYVQGYYTGNGTATRTIELGFKPALVIVFGESTVSYKTATLCITVSRNGSYAMYPTAKSYLLTATGFQISTSDGYSTSYNTNLNGTRYEYIAFR